MDHPELVRSRPVPRRSGLAMVQHPAWMEVRRAILKRSDTAGTILLVGPPGTGKSAMLRDLASHWRERGQAVTLVGQGDLPIELVEAQILLVDEALRMPAAGLDRLLVQKSGLVVLTDVDRLADVALKSTTVLRFRPLHDNDMLGFATEWLERNGLPDLVVAPDMLARLTLHAGGTVRLAVQLLSATAALGADNGEAAITGASVDHAAAMRHNWRVGPDTTLPNDKPPVPSIVRHPAVSTKRRTRQIAAVAAMAACVVLGWMLRPGEPPSSKEQPSVTAALPPFYPVEAADPTLLTRRAPDSAELATPRIVGVTMPSDAPTLTAGIMSPSPSPYAAVTPPPAMIGNSEVAVLTPAPASIPGPLTVTPAEVVPPRQTAVATVVPLAKPETSRLARRAGSPGMVLVARQGDTLESLYNDFYHDRTAPPYGDVVAVNPRPVQPGAMVFLPEPPGGWSATQR